MAIVEKNTNTSTRSAAVWFSTMEPPKHDLENPTVHGGVSDTTVGEDLLLRC
jgi:hypothetical protein